MEAIINLQGKAALVCGASQGIGAATARALADAGCRVTGLARSAEKLERVMGGLAGSGHDSLVQDLADRAGLAQAVAVRLGRAPYHILVNNTAGPKPGPISQAEEAAFLEGFQNHVLVSALLARLLIPGMKAEGYGRIVNIISTSVKVPIPNLGVSNTIRGAMANWAKTLSLELGPFGITVNNVLPGFTRTPRLDALIRTAAEKTGETEEAVAAQWQQTIPARRFADPAEVGAAVAFLASPDAGYINGINLPVDGGRTGCL